MANERFTIKKDGDKYRMAIPFGFDAKIEDGEVVMTKHWTILDAERGDIIAYGDEYPALICLRCVSGHNVYDYAGYWDYPDEDEPSGRFQKFSFGEGGAIDNIWGGPFRPATEEERNRFFEKMEKAGYEWDAALRKPKPKGEEIISVNVE